LVPRFLGFEAGDGTKCLYQVPRVWRVLRI
jgi:hypothetical protein